MDEELKLAQEGHLLDGRLREACVLSKVQYEGHDAEEEEEEEDCRDKGSTMDRRRLLED